VFEAVCADELELVAELVVEVADFEDELLVDDVLVDAVVVGAGALSGDGGDVEDPAVGLLEEGGEAGELCGEGWLLYAGGYVRAQESAAEGAMAGADGVVGEPEAWVAGDADELVVFGCAASGVEEAVFDVALDLEGVEVVRTFDDATSGCGGID
jgi:hypothetical protein